MRSTAEVATADSLLSSARFGDTVGGASTPRAQSTSASSSLDGDIRPMRMSPLLLRARHGGQPPAYMQPLSGGTGESGGGAPLPDKAPIITASGGGSGGGSWSATQKMDNGSPVEGEFEVATGIPVGTVASFTVEPPNASYVIDTVTWSNGSDVSGYFAAAADALAPEVVSVKKNVKDNMHTYKFIVTPEAKTYELEVEVTYKSTNPGGPSATGKAKVTFESIRPEATFSVNSNPEPQQMLPTQPHTIWYRDPAASAGMEFEAKTKKYEKFNGEYMIIQLANARRSYVDKDGVIYTMNTDWALDDGVNVPYASRLNLGMENQKNHNFWESFPIPAVMPEGETAEDVETNWASDPVPVRPPTPETDKSVTVGVPGAEPEPEKFKTFLMYKPLAPGGEAVWVALASIEWGLGLGLENNNGVWQVVPGTEQNPDPITTSPLPANSEDFWPTWSNRSWDVAHWLPPLPE